MCVFGHPLKKGTLQCHARTKPSFEFKDGISIRDGFGAPTQLQLL